MYKQFYNGLLEKHSMTKSDFEDAKYVYCGKEDDFDSERNYFKGFFKDKYIEKKALCIHEDYCVCSHYIQHNNYIYSALKDHILILGSCCILRFNPTKKKKLCEQCGHEHKNIVDNFCKDCRKKREYEQYIAKELEKSKIGKLELGSVYLKDGPFGKYLKYNNANYKVPIWGKDLIEKNEFDITTAKRIIDIKNKTART